MSGILREYFVTKFFVETLDAGNDLSGLNFAGENPRNLSTATRNLQAVKLVCKFCVLAGKIFRIFIGKIQPWQIISWFADVYTEFSGGPAVNFNLWRQWSAQWIKNAQKSGQLQHNQNKKQFIELLLKSLVNLLLPIIFIFYNNAIIMLEEFRDCQFCYWTKVYIFVLSDSVVSTTLFGEIRIPRNLQFGVGIADIAIIEAVRWGCDGGLC